MLETTTITCPHCGEPVELTLDLSVDTQAYVEDCSVCCRPMVISYRVEDGKVYGLTVRPENE